MGRVSMWLFWTTLLLVLPLGGLGLPLCLREPFYFLIAITKMLENKNDGSLYTPDNLLVCPAETLRCFRLELSVIGFEEGPSVGIAVFRLQRLLDALGSRLWVTGQKTLPVAPRARGRGKKEENKIFPPLSASRKGQCTLVL